LSAGALAEGRRAGQRSATVLILGVVLLLATTAGIVLAYEHSLPLAIDPALSPVAGRHPFAGVTAVVALQAAAGTLLLLAGAMSLRPDGPLFGWLGPALLVAGLASLNYALFPSLYSYWVYSGDILRLAFCVLLTCGIVVELRASARRAIEMAVLEERRRLARDLHDGIAQELAFIAAEIVDVPPSLHPSLPWIRSAVERGLFESRRAIAALTLPLDLPVAESIAAAASDIAARAGTSLRLDLDDTVEVSPAEHEAILRVVREAATNAVRHGRATTISVTLDGSQPGVTRLEISDDGSGIAATTATGGFGLTSMREPIEATGGALRLQSDPRGGTTVEARWRRGG
jgi:signal transduction histidine kinase